MPFINVKTNVPVGSDKEKAIKSALGQGYHRPARKDGELADGGAGA